MRSVKMTPISANIEPTDSSMPPVMMTKAMPIENTPNRPIRMPVTRLMMTIERFGGYEVNTVEWSPDGRKLLIGDSMGNAQLWNMRYFNRHIGGNMRYQLDRHRSKLGAEVPMADIEAQLKVLQDRARVGW